MENNQAKIDRVISYKFDFIGDYFRSQLTDHDQANRQDSIQSIGYSPPLGEIFNRSQKCLKGVAGLALISTHEDEKCYEIDTSFNSEAFVDIDRKIMEHVRDNAKHDDLLAKNILIGPTYVTDTDKFKTIYIPLEPENADVILAVTLSQNEFAGSDGNYYYTIIILFLAITLVTLLIINLLFKDFIRPLRHLVRGMEKMTAGNEQCRIEQARNDEIGLVASVFNNMSSALWEKRKQLTESNENLTDTLDQLSQANRSLEESEAFLSKVIDNSPFPIIATDSNQKIVVFSKAAISTFDIEPDEARTRDILDIFPLAADKLFPGEEKEVFQAEMICRKKSGETFPALVNRVPIREVSSQVVANLFIIQDISESRGFQEMMISIDRLATRGVMAGEIAHEINNYLAIILGNVELLPLLLAKGKMERFDQKLDVLKMTVTKIQRFSEGLMGYGDEEAVFQLGDLNQLIENLLAFLKPQNRYDNIKFNWSPSPEIPLVEFDGSQMQQLLVNLMNNAADALHEKPDYRQIDIITGLADSGNGVHITIADNAGGLPEDLHEVIFKGRYTGKRRGRGFGLLIARQITDKHSGQITYECRPGKGTSFNITLPIKMERSPVESQAEPSSQVTS
jgi:PAS domain S-box-containing protein